MVLDPFKQVEGQNKVLQELRVVCERFDNDHLRTPRGQSLFPIELEPFKMLPLWHRLHQCGGTTIRHLAIA